MKFNTKLLHGYSVFDEYTGASSIPLYQASTFEQKSIDNPPKYTYARFGNPTRAAVEDAVAALEDAKFGFAFSSGVAAISAVLLNFAQGDHLVMCKSIYGGTFQIATKILKRFGIEVTFVDETKPEAWEKAILANTKALYLETPSNPLLSVTDILEVVKIAKNNNLLTIIDNTFMTPQFQKTLQFGIDIIIHSATKFLNGHSDVVAGFVVVNDATLAEQIKAQQISLGAILGVQDSWLVMRGIKTMGIRMERSADNALTIAEFLETHAKIKCVNYPGLKSHPDYAINCKQASSGGAVLSFELESEEAVKKFFGAVKLPIVAVSLGGVESILSYPARMSHACVPKEERLKQGITDGLIRLSVGIEDIDDLIQDLSNALATL